MPEHPDGLAAAKRLAQPGLCIFCEEPLLPPGKHRPRIVCGSRDCAAAYNNAWRRDRRAGVTRRNLPAGARAIWTCPCRTRAYPTPSFRRHRKSCLFAAQAWPVVVVPAQSQQRRAA